MQLLDQANLVIKTPEVIAYIYQLVLAEPTITRIAVDLRPDPQVWGQSALHFAARHAISGAPLLLKVNVPPNQLWWTRRLAGHHPHLLPQVVATDDHLGQTNLGWILWERVRSSLHPGWHGREFDMLLTASVEFQRAARTLAPAAQAAQVVTELQLEDLAARLEQGIRRAAPAPAAEVFARLQEDWRWVTTACETEICHGDLHLANALCRDLPPDGVALLIDHHPTRMPWAYDAAKPEILNAEPARVGCRGLVARQATLRAGCGLAVPAHADVLRIQAIVLGWWAIQMWGYIGSSPAPSWRSRAIWHQENQVYIAAAAAA